jgi:penicillin amidase
VPTLVTGSNTHIAWGFTNTWADWGDLIVLDTDPANPNRYRTPDGWRDIQRFDEMISIAGEPDQPVTVAWTVWGPVLGPDHRGRLRAYSWVAHSATLLSNIQTKAALLFPASAYYLARSSCTSPSRHPLKPRINFLS